MDTILARMQLDPSRKFAELSAGLKRRVMLARGLVRDPDIVLLDEPTNHLDLDAIGWMEDFLPRYSGTLVFVTHDRIFLRRLATRIIEVDRGRLIDWACDYDTFSAAQAGGAGGRGHAAGRVRQEAGPGGGVDPAGHRGAAHAQRGPGACAGADAAAAPGAPGAAAAACACRCRRRSARASW